MLKDSLAVDGRFTVFHAPSDRGSKHELFSESILKELMDIRV